MSPQFLVSDLNRSIAFYTGNLGFEESFRYEDFYAGIMKDGHSIHLKSAKPSVDERKTREKNEHLDITFSVASIEELYSDFQTKSIDIVQPLRNMPYGKEFYIADPDGYIIAFLEEN